MTTEITTENKSAIQALADAIPAPDDIAPKSAEKEPPQELQTPIPVGGPAPPLATFADPEEGKRKVPARAKTRTTQATTPSTTKDVLKLFPSGVRVHVYKRSRSGSMAFVNDYSANDLQQQGSMERFLKEYVVPDYDYGEFTLYLQRPGKTDLEPIGSVAIEEPLSHKRNGNGNGKSEAKELMELMLQQQAAAQAAAASAKSPVEQLQETMTFLQTLSGSDKEKPGMDPMMLMLMMNMQAKPQVPTGPDPLMLKILERLERMEDERSMHMMMPPPPPPPPPDNSANETLAAMLQMMTAQQQASTQMMIAAMQNRAPDRDPVQDLANLTRLTGASDDRMTTKDFLAMLPALKSMIAPDPGKSSIGEALETLRSVKILEREFGGNPEAQASEGFWGFLRDLVTSDAGAKLAEAITAQQASEKVTERHQQRRMASNQAADQAQGRPHPQPEPEPEPEQPDGIAIPDSFYEYAQKTVNAAESSERLRHFIQGLQHLAGYADFRPYVAKMFGLVKQNKRIEALDFAARLLDAFIQAEAFDEETARLVMKDLDQFWTLMRQTLQMPDVPEVFPEGYQPKSEAESEDDEGDEVPEVDEGEDDDEVDPPRHRRPAREVIQTEAPEQREALPAPAE